MTLALDANANPTLVREDDQIGGMLTVSDGNLRRLMPEGNTASLVADNSRQLNIGNLRSDTPDVVDWHLMLLNPGYFREYRIKDYANGILTFYTPIEFREGLETLGANIEWVLFPKLEIPLGIFYKPDAGSSTLTIGLVKDNLWRPQMRPYAVLDAGQMLVIHTQQIQKFFVQAPNATASDPDRIMWGESYIA